MSCVYQYLDTCIPFQVNLIYEIFRTVKFIQAGSCLLLFTELAFLINSLQLYSFP